MFLKFQSRLRVVIFENMNGKMELDRSDKSSKHRMNQNWKYNQRKKMTYQKTNEMKTQQIE